MRSPRTRRAAPVPLPRADQRHRRRARRGASSAARGPATDPWSTSPTSAARPPPAGARDRARGRPRDAPRRAARRRQDAARPDDPGLLPDLDDEAALAATVVASVAGGAPVAGLVRRPPVRAPHHTASYAGMVGGGPRLSPGEVTLADQGVLFCDELPEFGRDVLEALRQPLEDGSVSVVRVGRADDVPRPVHVRRGDEPVPVRPVRVGRSRLQLPARRPGAVPAARLGSAPRPDRPVGRRGPVPPAPLVSAARSPSPRRRRGRGSPPPERRQAARNGRMPERPGRGPPRCGRCAGSRPTR